MNLSPYLGFNMNCREAFAFYARLFGGKLEMMFAGRDAPAEAKIPPEQRDVILHARLRIGDDVLMGGDMPGGWYQQPAGFSVSWTVASAAEADRLFAGLADGGNVRMPIGRTFWAERFGMVTDRYGTPWMINFPGDVHAP